jgi:hypothetical protein
MRREACVHVQQVSTAVVTTTLGGGCVGQGVRVSRAAAATHVNMSALRSSLRLSWLGWQRVEGDVVTRETRVAAPASVTADTVEKPAADELPPAVERCCNSS